MRTTLLAAVAGVALAAPTSAGELVYRPVNPNFGGSPLNGQHLLNNATLQDDHEDPRSRDSLAQRTASSLRAGDSFQDRVDRLVLNQLSRQILGNLTDPDTGLLVPGTIDTGISTIEITDLGADLEVVITNNATGETTRVLVPN